MLRLVAHATAGWAICAALMATLLGLSSVPVALGVHALAVPVVFALVARHYFRARGARDSNETAIAIVAIVASLDLVVVAGLVQRSLMMFTSVTGTWVPLALIGVVTWATGEWRWMAH